MQNIPVITGMFCINYPYQFVNSVEEWIIFIHIQLDIKIVSVTSQLDIKIVSVTSQLDIKIVSVTSLMPAD